MLLLFFVFTTLFGWFLIDLLKPQISRIEHLGLAVLIGNGIFTILYYLLSVYLQHLPLNTTLIQLAIYTCFVGLIWNKSKLRADHPVINFKKLNVFEFGLLTIFIFSLGYTLLQIFYWPPHNPDAIHLYDFRALRLLAGDIQGFYQGAQFINTLQYPPLTSLMHAFMYQMGSSNSGIFYGIFYSAFFATLFGYVFRSTQSQAKAIITIALLAMTPSLWWNSFLTITNVIYMEYISLGIIYLSGIGSPHRSRPLLLLSGLLLGLSTWLRAEILWVAILIPLGWYAYRAREFKVYLLVIFFTFTISSIWPQTQPSSIVPQIPQITVEVNSLKNITQRGSTLNIKDIVVVVSSSLLRAWSLIFPLYLLIVILESLKQRKVSPLHVYTLSIVIAITLGFILLSSRYAEWLNLRDAIYRMGLVALPLFWVGIITSPLTDNIQKCIFNSPIYKYL